MKKRILNKKTGKKVYKAFQAAKKQMNQSHEKTKKATHYKYKKSKL